MPRYDIIVIGGGIHGAGVAQAAAAAGLRVLLLEKARLAHGTSSRSSKLVHGGLRYLETGAFGLVRQALRERALLLKNAPELVRLAPFHIPVYRRGSRGRLAVRAGLSLYALLGGLSAETRFRRLPKRDWGQLDGLDTHGLQAVYRYFDAQTDDAALTRAVARSAVALGAEILCPARFLSAEQERGGYRVAFRAGAEREAFCAALVNAAGPWADAVAATIRPAVPQPAIELVQGAHVLIEGALERGCYYVEAADGRVVFFLPWRQATLVGTTETRFTGDPESVQARPEEIDYLQTAFARCFPARSIRVLSAFAGLRALPRSADPAFRRPRETALVAGARYVGIYGGKLTTYRATAEKALRLLRPALPARRRQAETAQLPLVPD